MKKILFGIAIIIASSLSLAQEKIVVLNPQGPSHSGTPQLMAVIDQANKQQNKYQFVIEFKPGAFESIALRELESNPSNRISTMTNAAIEGIDRGFINESSLLPVFGQGDSCWAVIAVTKNNKGIEGLKSLKEIVVGGPAIGGATHLTALEIGRKYNIPVRYVVYKSNYDAFITMVADSSINFIFERVKNYDSFKDKNPNMHIVAMSCPTRHPKRPEVRTLKEQGIDTPFIWQQIVANQSMPASKLQEIKAILTNATRAVGLEKIQELSDQTPPMFLGVSSEDFYKQSLSKLKMYREKFKQEIEASR